VGLETGGPRIPGSQWKLRLAVAPLRTADVTAPLPALTGDEISRLMEHHRSREILMRGYSVERTYSAQNESGKKCAVEVVRMEYTDAGEKNFGLISGSGSWVVRNLVFTRLRETETSVTTVILLTAC